MFLASLNKEQKMAYLNLSYALIAADGFIDEKEKAMMEQYKQEMNIEIQLAELSDDADSAITVFQNIPVSIKKQVLFELVGLAYAGDDYDDAERIYLEKCCAAWKLDISCIEQCKILATELMNIYGEISRFIFAP